MHSGTLSHWCFKGTESKKIKHIKGTVSDKKNLQIILDIKKNTFQSQYVPFISKRLHNFDRKMVFHKISFRGH